MSHQTKFIESVEVTPELVAFLRDKLESGNMSAGYIRELAAAATMESATMENKGSINPVVPEKFLEHSNVVPLEFPAPTNHPVDSEAASLADVAISLALYQAAGNSINNFDWDTASD